MTLMLHMVAQLLNSSDTGCKRTRHNPVQTPRGWGVAHHAGVVCLMNLPPLHSHRKDTLNLKTCQHTAPLQRHTSSHMPQPFSGHTFHVHAP
jgi:hypothetical protein